MKVGKVSNKTVNIQWISPLFNGMHMRNAALSRQTVERNQKYIDQMAIRVGK